MNRAIKFIIGFVAMIITLIICAMMEDALHNPKEMLFKVFDSIIFLIIFGTIASVFEFIYGRFFKKSN
ncbi:MAG: hypothetical protein H6Q69_3085 [Firmicutes bacterium]|nr:hypothetical protein [Bacillota bacterium]